MAATPSFSVLITAYNHLPYLPQALDSVYAQTLQDFEVVVLDDCSTDGTRRWIQRRRFPRLRYIRSEKNRGPAATRNAAVAAARAPRVAFLDGDDLWAPRYLDAMAAALAGSRALAACSDICTIDAMGRIIRRDFYRRNPKVRNPLFERLSGWRSCPALTSCVILRKAFSLVGTFDEGFKRIHDDSDFLFRLARRVGPAGFVFVPENLAYHRRHDSQVTSYIERGAAQDKELLLDNVYFSSKNDCRHCDACAPGGTGRAAPSRAGRSRTPAPAR